MAKKKKVVQKQRQGINKKELKIIVGVVVLAVVLYLVFLHLHTGKLAEVSTANQEYSAWLSDNCNCVERNNLRCMDASWTVDEGSRACRKNGTVTNVILGCSKYDCFGQNVTLSKGDWEPKINSS